MSEQNFEIAGVYSSRSFSRSAVHAYGRLRQHGFSKALQRNLSVSAGVTHRNSWARIFKFAVAAPDRIFFLLVTSLCLKRYVFSFGKSFSLVSMSIIDQQQNSTASWKRPCARVLFFLPLFSM
jgi:hypothetical protein